MLMKKTQVLGMMAVLVLLCAVTAKSWGQVTLQVKGKAALLLDCTVKQVLFAQNPDEKIEPASFTKVMTLYLVHDALRDGRIRRDDEVVVSKEAWRMGGSQMFIKVGEKVRVDDLMKGVAVVSGNDACVALAEHISGSEAVFVDDMNRKAQTLGLSNTTFKNCHGLPAEGQYTSARDMAELTYRYLYDYPQATELHSLQEFTYGGITQHNRNGLLRLGVGVDGLKTGYIETAGYHLVATAKKDGRRLIAVVMGTESPKTREQECLNLLNYGFRHFEVKEVFGKGQVVKIVPIARGKVDTVALVAAQRVTIVLSQQDKAALAVSEEIRSPLIAPVKKGEVLGKVTVEVPGKFRQEVDLLARDEVAKGWLSYWPYGAAAMVVLLVLVLAVRTGGRGKPGPNLVFRGK